MNYLAHLYLADYSDEALLGALLGDFVVGQAGLAEWPPATRLEIRLHRRIDSHTDAHPELLALKSAFPQGLRRFAGIALDVYFDHLLARDWTRHHAQPLQQFSARVYAVLLDRLPLLPPRLRAVAPLMAEHDWLHGYRRREAVDRALMRIAQRLSRGQGLIDCLPILRALEADIESTFESFLPQLQRFTQEERRRLLGAEPNA